MSSNDKTRTNVPKDKEDAPVYVPNPTPHTPGFDENEQRKTKT